MNRRVLYALFILALGLGLPGGMPASTHASELLVPTTPQVALGEPGMSFAYAQTYGVSGVPYLADTDHLYTPMGLFIDGDDNIYVTEDQGQRLLKYTSAGDNLLAIGWPGVFFSSDYSFCGIRDAVADAAGNVWVADGARVVKYDAGGNYLLTLEPEAPDYFLIVSGVALDSANHLFISDAGRERIQVYDISGPTPVYSSTIGMTDTPGSDAGYFNGPLRIAVDSHDRVIIVEGNAYQLGPDDWRAQRCAYSSGWTCEVIATGLYSPQGVTVDENDVIFIADTYNGRVRRCPGQGACSDLLTGIDVYDVAVDSSGNVYTASGGYDHVIAKYDSDGMFITNLIGEFGVPYLTDGYHYNHPTKVAVDADGNLAILEDEGNGHRLIVLDANGVLKFTIGEAGVTGDDNQHFYDARGVAFDANGTIYVGDCGNHRVQIFAGDGTYLDTLGSYGSGDYEFYCPSGLAFDSSSNLYVADTLNHRVQIFDDSFSLVHTLGVTGEPGDDDDHFNEPYDVAVDAAGNIVVTDFNNHRVQKFDSSYALQNTLGITGECGGDFDHFCQPVAVAVDSAGNIYVGEHENPRVQVFDLDGAFLTTIGGSWGWGSSQFFHVLGVEVDAAGDVYIPDMLNHRVQRFHLGVPGWEQVNLNGFGSRWVEQIPSLEVFNEALYAGTSNYNEGTHHIFFTADGHDWQEVSHEFEGGVSTLQSFKGFLYAGTWEGMLWRSEDGINWTNVFTSPQGFGSFSVFDNTLYAGTYSVSPEEGITIYKTTNGTDWETFVADGNGDPGAKGTVAGVTFHNFHYFGIGDWSGGVGGRIWRTDGITVTEVVGDGFGNPENYAPGGLTTFGDWIYASIANPDSNQVWRSDSGDEDSWVMVFEFGQGTPGSKGQTGLIVYNSQLFLTAQNDWSGVTVWRTVDGLDWHQLGFDGFGDSNNVRTEWGSGLQTFAGRLIIGVNNYGNGGEVWTYDPDILWLPLMSK